jgi:Skp family chaperone for outer membrane proteins
MKQIVTFTAIAVFALSACGENKKDKKAEPAKVEQRQAGTLKIAFYDQDSLKLYFQYYKEQDSIFERKQVGFQREVERMSKEYQEFLQRNDERARQGLLSQIQIQKIQEEAAGRERKIVEYQQSTGARLEKETYTKLEEIGKKIDTYSKMYCEENNLDILLIRAKGGQLAYMSPTMDVTKSFIDYLNEYEVEIARDMGKKK